MIESLIICRSITISRHIMSMMLISCRPHDDLSKSNMCCIKLPISLRECYRADNML
uniref:Uncharacterized protein n=1 Tax=Arundo donax TaxID=35708 RepID=A0A0A9BCW5_ARUDO